MRPLRDALTVVIITHNRVQDLMRSLQHMDGLSEAPQIIVVDNASTDGTAAAVRERFPLVSVIELERNIGAAARNIGARLADTRYIALCDDDSWWEPGSLGLAVAVMDREPRIAAVCARVLLGSGRRLDPACEAMAASPLPRRQMPGPVLLGFIACATVLRTDAFLAAGGYREQFFVGGEEALLALDLTAGGRAVVYLPSLTVRHFPSLQRDNGQRRIVLIRNALWVAWLRLPLAAALSESLRICREARAWRPLLAALAQSLREVRWIWRERKVLPPEVQAWYRMLH